MHQAAHADAERSRNPAAPSQLHAAADHIGGVGTGRDIQQKPRRQEQPEIMNAEHVMLPGCEGQSSYLNSGVPGTKASNAAQNCAR